MMLTQFPSWRTWDVKGVEHEAHVRVGGNCVSIVRLTSLGPVFRGASGVGLRHKP